MERISRDERELNRVILNSLSAHIAVLERGGEIVQVNGAWERFALQNGASSLAAVSVGANYLDVCRRASAANSEQASKALQAISSVLEGTQDHCELEYPCHSPNEFRWFVLTVVPLKAEGRGAVVSHTDITERVLADIQRKQTYDFFRALIENASDIVTIVDRNGIIKYQSPSIQRVLGYGQHELEGRSCFEFFHPDDVPRLRNNLESLRKPGSSTPPVEFSFLDQSGRWRILEGIATNAEDNAAVNGIVVTSRDVTERRLAESEVRAKEAALRDSHRSLQAVTRRLLQAEETERRRISRELHDDLNQKLAALAVDVGSVARTLPASDATAVEKELRALQSRLTRICNQVRTMAYQLHPSILDDLGLAVAMRSWCAEFSRREGIEVKFVARKLPHAISHDIGTVVYRIAQEALRNVAKHSGAKAATVSLIGSPETICLTVRDTGAGFMPSAAKAHRGLGLISMEERARMLGGVFEIASRPRNGTTVTVRIPWKRKED